jgi:sarcosine oxidase, subunit gamma
MVKPAAVPVSALPVFALAALTLPSRLPSITLSDAGHAARFIFRGSVEVLQAALGTILTTTPCRATTVADITALWLGPDEWLLMLPPVSAAPLRAKFPIASAQVPSSLVDVSHRSAGVVLNGKEAPDVLNAGCPLDLDEAAFPVGMCARTLFGKAEIVLWRTAPSTFHLEVWRSFALYVVGLLSEAIDANQKVEASNSTRGAA